MQLEFWPDECVTLRVWEDNPGFWDDDGDMLHAAQLGGVYMIAEKLTSTTYKVIPIDVPEDAPNITYFTWRSIDLLPLEGKDILNNPNYIFRRKKSCLDQNS